METSDGDPIMLNKAGEKVQLVTGDNQLEFQAYVQGEPGAIASKTIERGPFRAVATFSLEYE